MRSGATLTAFVILAAGCGGGSSSDGNGGGTALSIGGTPPSQILYDTPFSFAPQVTAPAGVPLSFSATSLPAWAAIDSSTGRVTGTPGLAHIGVYSNIRLTVSGGGQTASSPAYTVTVVAAASGRATVSWIPPTTRTNGTVLGASLAGYRIHYGQSPTVLNQSVTINNPAVTTVVVENLTPGPWYFAATAFDTSGLHSAHSNTGSKTVF
jgi:hypothetical protein